MKIVIAAVSSTVELSGVLRHAANLTRCLLTRSEVSAVHLMVAPWQQASMHEAVSRSDSRLSIHAVRVGPGILSRNAWYYWALPSLASQVGADVVHLAYPAPLDGVRFQCPTVVSLHDLYPYDTPANFGYPKVIFNRLVLWQCLRAADAIACVSDSTHKQLAARAPLLVNKALTIYNCVEPASQVSARGPLPLWNGEPFFLCIAQHRRNKNLILTVKIFERLRRSLEIDPATRLVIIGVPGPETSPLLREIRAAGLAEKVVFLRGIRDSDIQWCYRNCELLLAPSTVEGFGLPVAEAMLAGCRIVCSDIPAFRELGGDVCHYVQLGMSAEERFAKAIVAALREPRGNPCSLPQLAAPVIAEEYMRLYRRLLLARSRNARQADLLHRSEEGGVGK
jgi:glycosyltransferase involved in cell wall biosynthesis